MPKDTPVSTWDDFTEIKKSLQEALDLLKLEIDLTPDIPEEVKILPDDKDTDEVPSSLSDDNTEEPDPILAVLSEAVFEEPETDGAIHEVLSDFMNEPVDKDTNEANDEVPSDIIDEPEDKVSPESEPDNSEPVAGSDTSEKSNNGYTVQATPDSTILKAGESREELNKALQLARDMVNTQSKESLNREKKRFKFAFKRDAVQEKPKSKPVKIKKNKNFAVTPVPVKPMVYEFMNVKKGEAVVNMSKHEDITVRKYPETVSNRHEDTPVKKNSAKEMHSLRNIPQSSKKLGVTVFVDNPVNIEQIQKLKSSISDVDGLKIVIDTGSTQGQALVISGQDLDALHDTLSALSIVDSAIIEDEAINLVLKSVGLS